MQPDSLTRFGARLVHSTVLIDKAYRRFEQLRSLLVLSFASESFLEAHSRLAYGASSSYRADSPNFRRGLFSWERQVVRDFFPKPPARVLVGGAGGGREAYALVEMGYSVAAFDPAPALAGSMQDKAKPEYAGLLETYCAAYQDVPVMPAWRGARAVDLRSQPPFGAAILGWCSFSHLLEDSARVDALKGFAALTRGPLLVSFFSDQAQPFPESSRGGLVRALHRRARRRGNSMFTTGIGYARLLTESDLKDIVSRAGLVIVHFDRESDWPFAVLRAPAA